jgi:hypothetical protein
MPKLTKIDLVQLNKHIDRIDRLEKQVGDLKVLLDNVGHSATISDPTHAPETTNNLTFTWNGPSLTLSWTKGYIKDKNWSAQLARGIPVKSSAPGAKHLWLVPAGQLSPITASTAIWLAWDPVHQIMRKTADVSTLHNNSNLLVLCRITTGTAAQSGVAGGGGSSNGSDISGAQYAVF